VFWMLAALAPATFFTWGNVSRYLYLPSAAFSLLLAQGIGAGSHVLRRRLPVRVSDAIAAIATTLIAARFAAFAVQGADMIARRAQPYQRFADALRRSAPAAAPGALVRVDAADLDAIPDLYRQSA